MRKLRGGARIPTDSSHQTATMSERTTKLVRWTAFIAAYVALDWGSFLHATHGLNITPWNPALALGLAVSMKHGRDTILPWFIALLLGEMLVRGLPSPLLNTLIQSACLAACYSGIADIIRRNFNMSGGLSNQRNFFFWLAVVVFGTFLTSCIYLLLLFFSGLIPAEEWRLLVLRFWIGDCVGAIAAMPFFWMLIEHHGRLRQVLVRWDTLGYTSLAVIMVGIAFGRWEVDDFKYFHLMFLPLVWAAAAQGFAGAAIAAFILQTGVIVAVQWLRLLDSMVFEMQLMAAVLASVGFYIGVLIDERQRINAELRQTLRLAAAAEMAGALAHEINQPLTALSAYGTVCEQLLARGETGNRLSDTIGRMVSESRRAAEVVRRLRDFFRTGATRIERVTARDLLASGTDTLRVKAGQLGIQLSMETAPEVFLLADRMQIEVVLRNLISNAFEALSEKRPDHPHVKVTAIVTDDAKLCITVADNGPGLSRNAVQRVFEPFHSTKSSGLGLGLAISRAIAEAHGGTLLAEEANHGMFKLILPLEELTDDAD